MESEEALSTWRPDAAFLDLLGLPPSCAVRAPRRIAHWCGPHAGQLNAPLVPFGRLAMFPFDHLG